MPAPWCVCEGQKTTFDSLHSRVLCWLVGWFFLVSEAQHTPDWLAQELPGDSAPESHPHVGDLGYGFESPHLAFHCQSCVTSAFTH